MSGRACLFAVFAILTGFGVQPDAKVEIAIQVVDAETGELLPHRISVENAQGILHFPQNRGPRARRKRRQDGDQTELEVIDGARVWSLQPAGTAFLRLPATDGFVLRIQHGLEYERLTESLDLADREGESVELQFELRRSIDMQARGWMSADTHVHAMTPNAMRVAMTVEDVDYANLMLYLEDDTAWATGLGLTEPPDGDDHIVFISQEIRDFQQGHLTLLGLKDPIEPRLEYSGRSKHQAILPARPNEPLNWDVVEQARSQGALAVHANSLLWPGHGLAACAGLGELDGVEWLETDIVTKLYESRQEIEVTGFDGRSTNAIWYRLLDCGRQLPLLAGTDKFGNAMTIGGSARTYVQVPRWDHIGFLEGVAAGATFVTNGPLLFFEVEGQPPGSTIPLTGDGPFKVGVSIECHSWSPIDVIEIVRDGMVVSRIPSEGDRATGYSVQAERTIEFRRSGWLAVRARAIEADLESWQGRIPAAHTSAVRIQVDGLPARPNRSARYFINRLDASRDWAESEGEWSSEATKAQALEGFRRARAYFERQLRGH